MVEGVVWVEAVEDQGEEEGEDAEQVDDVEEGGEEVELVGGHEQPGSGVIIAQISSENRW